MRLLQTLYLYWFLFVTILSFLTLYPITFLFLLTNKTYRLAHFMNKVWGVFTFTLAFIPWWKIKEEKLPDKAVFCANHFSFIDIPAIFLAVPGYFSIIGKSSLNKVPLFGFMFKKLYISVNRSHGKNRYEAFEKGLDMIDSGRSMVIYPEGGIKAKTPPQMAPFKDGAFKIAIQKKTPIVPVTIYNNWIILKDEKKKRMKWRPSKVKFHSPIETKTLSLEDVDSLKAKVYSVIDKELKIEFGK